MEERTAEMTAAASFEAERAILSKRDMFPPLTLGRTEPLNGALNRKRVRPSTPLLLLERDGAALAMHTHQMAYHHVAQGDWNGSPVLASF